MGLVEDICRLKDNDVNGRLTRYKESEPIITDAKNYRFALQERTDSLGWQANAVIIIPAKHAMDSKVFLSQTEQPDKLIFAVYVSEPGRFAHDPSYG